MGGHWVVPVGAVGCSGGPQPGTTALEAAVLAVWSTRGATSLGTYNCRKIAGSDEWSLHAEGRAVDIDVDWPPSALGSEVLARVTSAALGLGIQRVIYDGWIYDTFDEQGRPFDDGGAHRTHLHIEQGWAGAHDLVADVAHQLLDPLDREDDGPVVLLQALDHPTSTTYWLLSGGRRIYLSNFTNVKALMDAGAAVIRLPDSTLNQLPEVR